MTALSLLHRRVRRALLGRRRPLAALFAAVTVAAALRVVNPGPPPTAPVLTATRDLPAGSVVRSSDLQQSAFALGTVPAGALSASEVVGRTTAAPLRSGEALTDVRLVQGSLLDGYPGMVAAPVRIGDADAVRLLRVGDRIDLLAADQGPSATLLASDVPVIALPPERSAGGTVEGALVIVAISDITARRVAAHAPTSLVSLVIRR